MTTAKVEWLVWVVAEQTSFGCVWISVHGSKDLAEERAKRSPVNCIVLQADLIAERPLPPLPVHESSDRS